MACDTVLPLAVLEDGTLDVIDKVRVLSEAALAADSVYMRAKDTFKELFDANKINETEYAQLAAQFVSQLAVTTTQEVLRGALQWAEQEKTLGYSLAKLKADIALTQAQRELVGHQICATDKEIDLKCAQITSTISQSIRENGRVATKAADGCTPLTLQAEGTKYAQELHLEAQKYATLSDAYRKSGVVTIATDGDGIEKGVAGTQSGYTDAQDSFARRQILSFEDSKRSHAANAVSQFMGQLLASDQDASGYLPQWDAALNYLNTNSVAVTGNGSMLLDLAIAKISLYAVNSANPVPTLIDYLSTGMTGINSLNLTAMNAAVAAKTLASEVDSVAELQVICNSLVY